MAISVGIPTETTAMKMKAWAMVGGVCPTFRVPGMRSSATIPRSL